MGKSKEDIIDGVLSSKIKFRRAVKILLLVLGTITIIACVGFYTGELSKIITSLLK